MKSRRFVFILTLVLLALSAALLASQSGSNPPSEKPAAPVPQRVRAGGKVMGDRIIHKVDIEYPELAKKNNVKGTVRVEIVIDGDGSVMETNVISGNPLLAKAVTDAVRQWRYRPMTVNHVPVQVVTEVDVEFKPSRVEVFFRHL